MFGSSTKWHDRTGTPMQESRGKRCNGCALISHPYFQRLCVCTCAQDAACVAGVSSRVRAPCVLSPSGLFHPKQPDDLGRLNRTRPPQESSRGCLQLSHSRPALAQLPERGLPRHRCRPPRTAPADSPGPARPKRARHTNPTETAGRPLTPRANERHEDILSLSHLQCKWGPSCLCQNNLRGSLHDPRSSAPPAWVINDGRAAGLSCADAGGTPRADSGCKTSACSSHRSSSKARAVPASTPTQGTRKDADAFCAMWAVAAGATKLGGTCARRVRTAASCRRVTHTQRARGAKCSDTHRRPDAPAGRRGVSSLSML